MTLKWRHIIEYLYCGDDWQLEVLLLEYCAEYRIDTIEYFTDTATEYTVHRVRKKHSGYFWS